MGFAENFRNAFVGVHAPQARAGEQKAAMYQQGGDLFNQYRAQLLAQGLDPNSREYWNAFQPLMMGSGNEFLMEKPSMDLMDKIYTPPADPMLTDDLKEIAAMGVDLSDPVAVQNAYLMLKTKVARAGATNIHMPGPSTGVQDRYLTEEENKQLVDENGNSFPYGTTIQQAMAAGAKNKSEVKQPQLDAGQAASSMALAEDQYSQHEMTDEERTPAMTAPYVKTGIQNMFYDIPLPQVIKAPLVGAKTQGRKDSEKFWTEFPLRDETGAVVADAEKTEWGNMYFAQQGDTPEIANDKKARRIALQTMKKQISSGRVPSFNPVKLGPGIYSIGEYQAPGMDAPAKVYLGKGGSFSMVLPNGESKVFSATEFNNMVLSAGFKK